VSETHGTTAIACLGSSRSSLENQGELKRFCQLQGWPKPQFFMDQSEERKVKDAVSRLDGRRAVSMTEIEGADFILGVGVDPINEAPMLAMAMRQAQRNGENVAMIDPRPLFLPFEFDHFPVAVADLNHCLSVAVKGAVDGSKVEKLGAEALQFFDALPNDYSSNPLMQDRLLALGQRLKQSQRPVIVCGTDIVQETTPGLSADLVLLLQFTKQAAGLFYIMPGPNAYGAALLSSPDGSARQIIEDMESGRIKALLLMESDPFWAFPDRERLLKALDSLDLLLVLDYLPSSSAELAHILLPTTTAFERVGSVFINQRRSTHLNGQRGQTSATDLLECHSRGRAENGGGDPLRPCINHCSTRKRCA
jgi:NADH-quinone oxidoreductase subunit G